MSFQQIHLQHRPACCYTLLPYPFKPAEVPKELLNRFSGSKWFVSLTLKCNPSCLMENSQTIADSQTIAEKHRISHVTFGLLRDCYSQAHYFVFSILYHGSFLFVFLNS